MVCPGPSRSPQCLAHSRCVWHAVGAQEKTHCLNAGPAVRVPQRPARGPVSGLWLSSPRPPRARPPKDVASARHAHHAMLGPVLWPCPGPAPSSPRPLRTPSLSPGSHIRDITPTPKSPLMWGPRPPHPKTWTPQNTRGPGLSPPVSGEDGPRSSSVSVASARAAAKVRRGPEATRALPAGFQVTIQSRSLFLAKGGAPGRLPWAWGGGTRWPSRGGAGTAALGGGRRGRPRPRARARAQALTEVGGPFAVVAGHVGAAAPVALADAALVQRVGGEEHAVTADGLREGGQGLLGRPCGGHRRGAQAGGQRHEASGSV